MGFFLSEEESGFVYFGWFSRSSLSLSSHPFQMLVPFWLSNWKLWALFSRLAEFVFNLKHYSSLNYWLICIFFAQLHITKCIWLQRKSEVQNVADNQTWGDRNYTTGKHLGIFMIKTLIQGFCLLVCSVFNWTLFKVIQ